jgi:hypothetical protein
MEYDIWTSEKWGQTAFFAGADLCGIRHCGGEKGSQSPFFRRLFLKGFMSVVGYFASPTDLRIKAAEVGKSVAEVSGGELRAEELQTDVLPTEERHSTSWPPLHETLPRPSVVARVSGDDRYRSVGDYDAVLLAHCRLDREG